MDSREYIHRVKLHLLQVNPWRRAILLRELRDHLADHAARLEGEGRPVEEADALAAQAMGDPVRTARALEQLYRPRSWPLALAILTVALVFSLLYAFREPSWGLEYGSGFLPRQWVGRVEVFSGQSREGEVSLWLEPSGEIWYACGDVTRGPFTLTDAPDALPPDPAPDIRGVELREGDTLLFRGGWSRRHASFRQASGEEWFGAGGPSAFALMDIWEGELDSDGKVRFLWLGLLVMALGLLALWWGDSGRDLTALVQLNRLLTLGPAVYGAAMAADAALSHTGAGEKLAEWSDDPWLRSARPRVAAVLMAVLGAAICALGLWLETI